MGVKLTEITKPFGSGAAAISVKSLIEKLKIDYRELESDMDVEVMKIKSNYFMFFNLPSKANSKYPDDRIYYDIVFEFIPPNSAWEKESRSLFDWDIKVFSNMPNFMFTFTYAFNKRHALIDLPKKYYSLKALKVPPKMKNPYLFLGIDEGLWLCVQYMEKHNLLDRSIIDNLLFSSTLDWKTLLEELDSQEDKLQEANNRDLRHRAASKRKNSKLWKNGKAKEELKNQLKEEEHALRHETTPTKEGEEKKKRLLKANMKAQLELTNSSKEKFSMKDTLLHINPFKKKFSMKANMKSNL